MISASTRPRRLVLLVLLLAGLTTRFWRLDALSLWLDEGGTWVEASRSWGALLADLLNPRAAYPLYHVLMKAWVTLAGDSEWALRAPSALAGALALPLLYSLGARLGSPRAGLLGALALLLNPAALFYSQDAKVYSVLLLLLLATLWALAAALQRGGRRRWLLWLGLVLLALLMQRLALFSVVGQVLVALLLAPLSTRQRRWLALVPLLLTIALVLGIASGVRQDPNAPPVGATAGPLTGLLVLWGRLNLDRAPGAAWLPLLLLALAAVTGLAVLVRCWQAGQRLPLGLLLGYGAVPLGLFLLLLALGMPIFEPRYMSFLLPLLALVYGYAGAALLSRPWGRGLALGALAGLFVAQGWALLAPPYGLWSGTAIKEDYRAAVTALAQRITPEDAVVVHPAYIRPLYTYYARRVTPDPLPEALTFGRAGSLGWDQGEFDNDYAALLAPYERVWLLIAPLNARTIDPPDPQFPDDDMGRVGINFVTADHNGKWRCTDEPWLAFNGVRLLCQTFPARIRPPELDPRDPWPVPQSLTAAWEHGLRLRGFTWLPWPAYRPGGTLPLELVWQADDTLPQNYRLFVHLLPALGAPVAAQRDTQPLYGGLPTLQWPAGRPIHDRVAVPLPADLVPGRYLVVLGWYDPTIPDVEAQRLRVLDHSGAAGSSYIELGTVEVGP